MATIFNISNSTLSLASLIFGLIRFKVNFIVKQNFRLKSQSLIISRINSTISLIDSIFMNTYFNNTMIDLSFFQNIHFENIRFINSYIFCGLKIQNGNVSRVIMKSIKFNTIYFDDYFLIFNSLDSTLLMHEIELFSFVSTKSKKKNWNL